MNFKRILLISILSIIVIMIPITILAFLNIGSNPIFITLIVLVSFLVILLIIFIIHDLIRIMKNKKTTGKKMDENSLT